MYHNETQLVGMFSKFSVHNLLQITDGKMAEMFSKSFSGRLISAGLC